MSIKLHFGRRVASVPVAYQEKVVNYLRSWVRSYRKANPKYTQNPTVLGTKCRHRQGNLTHCLLQVTDSNWK